MADLVLLEDKLPILAREIAMGIYEVEDILGRYGVGWDEFERINTLPRFQRLLETTTVEWGSTLNTRERIKVKALAGLEDGLPELFRAAKDSRETLASRVEAFKLARVLGGIGERDPNEIAPEKFTLTINVGDTSTVVGGPVIESSASATRENVPTVPDLVKDELFEFTSEARAPQGVIQARVRAMTADDGLNDDLKAGFREEEHGQE